MRTSLRKKETNGKWNKNRVRLNVDICVFMYVLTMGTCVDVGGAWGRAKWGGSGRQGDWWMWV